jgi:hypothetical protein
VKGQVQGGKTVISLFVSVMEFDSAYTLARGTYSVDGDLYGEQSNNGNYPVPMKYKYTADGTNLKFDLNDQSKNDLCGERKMGFDGVTYMLSNSGTIVAGRRQGRTSARLCGTVRGFCKSNTPHRAFDG